VKTNILLLSLITAFALVSCKGSPDIIISEKTGNKTILTSPGKTVSIELKSQISTGFSWRLKDEPEKITLLQEEIITLKQMPGAPELHKFLFKAAKKGKEKLIFNYARHWMKKPKAAKTFEVEVEVK